MNNNCLISIIVPVYNVGKYLHECIDSILAQRYDNFELILVNDGSTDDSSAIINQYAEIDRRIKAIDIVHGGVSKARNAGIDAAIGSYIAFIDGDDTVAPTYLSSLYDLVSAHDSDVAAVGFTRHKSFDISARNITHLTGRQACRLMLYQHSIDCSVWGKIFRATLFKARHFKDNIHFEDLEWMIVTLSHCSVVTISDAKLYYYRYRPDSFINSFSPHRFDAFYIINDAKTSFNGDNDMINAVNARLFSAAYNALLLLYRNNYYDETFKAQVWDVIKSLRRKMLASPEVRLKNKCGALCSFLGRRAVISIARLPWLK